MTDQEIEERLYVIHANWTLVRVAKDVFCQMLPGVEYGIEPGEMAQVQATLETWFQRLYGMIK